MNTRCIDFLQEEIVTPVLANTVANFKTNGFSSLSGDATREICCYCFKFTTFINGEDYNIYLNYDVQEMASLGKEMLIEYMCYRLLVWLNNLTFDNRC